MSWLAELSKNHIQLNSISSSYSIDGSSFSKGTSSAANEDFFTFEDELFIPPSLAHYMEDRFDYEENSCTGVNTSNPIELSKVLNTSVPVVPVTTGDNTSNPIELSNVRNTSVPVVPVATDQVQPEVSSPSEPREDLVDTVQSLLVSNDMYSTRIAELEKVTKTLQSDLVRSEKDLAQLMQYNRRENVEIVGIPANVADKDLETVVMDIFQRLGLKNLSYYDIAGCHRLKNRRSSSSNVIVRFLCRKRAHEVFDNAFNIKQKFPEFPQLQFRENLCPKYKLIFDRCMDLLNRNIVKDVWTFNGTIFIKKTTNKNEKPKTILHMSDLLYHFEGISI